MSARPNIPKKLPVGSRRPLSLSTDANTSNITYSSEKCAEECGNEYVSPIEQPSLNLLKENTIATDLQFFNEYDYGSIDKEQVINNQNKNTKSLDVSDTDYQILSESISNFKLDPSNQLKKQIDSLEDSLNSSISNKEETTDSSEKPPIPPKRSKLSSSISLKYISVSVVEDDEKDYVSPTESQIYSLSYFKEEIFKSIENRICADCKDSSQPILWLSCFYCITLCNSCALIHSKLLHRVYDYYLINIDAIYHKFQNSPIKIRNLLKMLALSGNEKMNSLFEFQIELARDYLLNAGIEAYIKAKYLEKSFVDTNELDLSGNYNEELNKNLCKYVCTPCVSLAGYFLFLGVNIHIVDEKSRSLLEIAQQSNQTIQEFYLELNQCFSLKTSPINEDSILKLLVNYEVEGCLEQILDQNYSQKSKIILKENVYARLNSEEIIINRYFKKEISTRINYMFIIKIFAHTKKFHTNQSNNVIEIKWCNKANNSLITTLLESSNNFEKQNWLREFFYKIFYNFNLKFQDLTSCRNFQLENRIISLFELIKSCQITAIGFLNLMNPIYLEADSNEQVLIILLESMQIQESQFFKRYLIIIKQMHIENINNLNFYEILDLRKLVRIKMSNNSITIDMPSKTFILKSNGYTQNLNFWYEKIQHMSELQCSSIEEQYLSKDDYPLLIEKCFSCVEMNFLSDNKFYFNLTNQSPINLKKAGQLYQKLLKEKCFELDANKCNPILILNIVRLFISNFVKSFHLNLLKSNDKNEKFPNVHTSNNTVFFSTFKRVCIHLNIILNFKNYNQINVYDLVTLFSSMFLNGSELTFDFEQILINYTENCTELFDLKNDYLNIQYKMAEKSIKLKEIKNQTSALSLQPESKFLLTIYLFHKHSDQSFQLNVSSNFTCQDVLILARKEFNLCESKYWSLFEVFDNEQHKLLNEPNSNSFNNLILLERIMPLSSKLIDNLSKWNSFNLVVKCNFIQINLEKYFLTGDSYQCPLSFRDECESLVICESCGFYRTSKLSLCHHESSHKKWIKSFLQVQNGNIIIGKKICIKGRHFDSESEQSFKTSVIFQAPIESCVFYYGLYEKSTSGISNKQKVYHDSSEDLNKSFSSFSTTKYFSGSVSEMFINEEECITFFDGKSTNNCYCIHFESKENALARYSSLFKLAFCDKWSCFESNHLPLQKPKVPELPRRPSFIRDLN